MHPRLYVEELNLRDVQFGLRVPKLSTRRLVEGAFLGEFGLCGLEVGLCGLKVGFQLAFGFGEVGFKGFDTRRWDDPSLFHDSWNDHYYSDTNYPQW